MQTPDDSDLDSSLSLELDIFQQEVLLKGHTQPFDEPWWQGRAFQLCARAQGIRSKRFIISMDKGMGKTSTIYGLFEPLANEWDANHTSKWTVLILTTKRGMTAYLRDIKKFPNLYDQKIQLVHTTKQGVGARRLRWNLWRNTSARYFITTYAGLLSDMGYMAHKLGSNLEAICPPWVMNAQMDGIVCDEFHRVFRNRTSSTFNLLHDFFKKVEYFIPMSGSAFSDGPEDIWPALHLCDPKMWSSYWKYVATWCEINAGPFGKQVRGPKLDPKKMGGVDLERGKKWRQAIRPYIFHVTAEMVPNELPPINNYPLDVFMTDDQKEVHDTLRKRLFLETPDGEFMFNENTLTNRHSIRLSLICPKAIHEDYGYGAGIEAIVDDVDESNIRAYAVFTPFKKPIPHLKEYLESRGHSVTVLQGGITVEEQEARLNAWRTCCDGLKPNCLLSTIKYAESWEIPEAKDGYFLGYEDDPEDNDQARKRLRRLISKEPVRIQWIRHLGSYDEDHLTRLMEKTDGKRAMLDPWYKRG